MTLLKMSFYGAVIILAVLLIRSFTLHKLPKKTFLILWAVALLRLLVPFEIASDFSIYSLLPDNIGFTDNTDVYIPNPANPYEPFQNYADYLKNQSETQQFNNDAVIVEPTGAVIYLPNENPDAEAVPLPNVDTDVRPIGEISASDTVRSENTRGITLQMMTNKVLPILPILWCIGALLCAAFFLISYIKCYLEFRTSLPVTEEYAAKWLKQHPLKRKIELRQSDKISAPLTYGIFRPVILMPKKTDWDNQAELAYVLYHEFTHIRRFDLLAKLLMLVAVCFHWFNPFVWTMYFFFNRDLELSCDDCVVKHFKESKADYAHTLIGMEEKKNYSTPLCNHFSRNAIEERITAIMKSKKTTIGMVIAAIIIVAAVVVTLTTGRRKEEAPNSIPAETIIPSVTATPIPTVTTSAKPTPPPGGDTYFPERNYTYKEDDLAKFEYSGSTISPKDGYDFVISTLVSVSGESILSDLTINLEAYAGNTAWWCLAAFYDEDTNNVYLEFVPAAGVEDAPSGILHVTVPVTNPTAYTVLPAGNFDEQKASAFWFSDICKIKNRIYFNNGSHFGSLWVLDLTTGEMSDLSYVNEKMQELANEVCADFGWEQEPAIWLNVWYESTQNTMAYTANVCKEMDTEAVYTLYLYYNSEKLLDSHATNRGESGTVYFPYTDGNWYIWNHEYTRYHDFDPDANFIDEQMPATGSVPTTDGPDWYNAVSKLMNGYTPKNTVKLPHDTVVPDYAVSALKAQAASYLAQCGLGVTHRAGCYAVCQTNGYTIYAADISYAKDSPIYFTVYHAYDGTELVGKVISRHQITFYDTENLSHAWANYITMDDVVTMAKEELEKFYDTKNYSRPYEITSIHMSFFDTIEVKFRIPESDDFAIYTEATVEFTYDFSTEEWNVSYFKEIPPDYLSSYASFPRLAAKDVTVTGGNCGISNLTLTYLDEAELPRYQELAKAGAKAVVEESDYINVGRWHTLSLNGISYFFYREDAPTNNDEAFAIAITSPDYPLSGGAMVGMTTEELLTLYPDLAKSSLINEDPVFEAQYGPSMYGFRADQFPPAFLSEYEYAYIALTQKEYPGLPVCIAFLIKDDIVSAITEYLPTAN